MSTHLSKKIRITTSVVAIALCLSAAAVADKRVYPFDIPAQDTAHALTDFARQADVQILFPYDVASKFKTPRIKGDLTRDEVLARLIDGTGLEIASASATTIVLKVSAKSTETAEATDGQALIEVTVTGSHLRTAKPTSPVRALVRSDIERSGFSQTGDLVRSLPENFSGGQNPGMIGTNGSRSDNSNVSNASTINLRGLGSDATLVLVNGHRISADSYFQGGDVSGIPLSAVKRVEIVTDGASAIYGADAVAGVVNFILNKTLNGGEASLRIGDTTEGGGAEQTASVMLGHAADGWNVLGSFEYSNQAEIKAGDRKLTAASPPIKSMLRPQTRRSAFLTIGKSFGDTTQVGVDVLVSDRRMEQVMKATPTAEVYYSTMYTPAYNVAAYLTKDFGAWQARFIAAGAQSRNSGYTRTATIAPAQTNYKNGVAYGEFVVEGPVSLGPLSIDLAVGGGYREDRFQNYLPGDPTYIKAQRTVSYGFAEAFVPVLAPSTERGGLYALDLSLSVRTEKYDDVGSTTNPKIGVRYQPTDEVVLRGTWGTSFKAPSFLQMYQTSYLYLYRSAPLGYTGGGTALLTNGGNPNLKPETSESWTAGAEYAPKRVPTLRLTATYFNIDFTNRTVRPIARLPGSLANPIYAPFIEWNPSASRQAAVFAAADQFINNASVAYDPAAVVVLLKNDFQNASAQYIRGIDFSYRQSFTVGEDRLNLFLNASKLQVKQQTIVTLPAVEFTGTILNPAKVRARGGATWQRGNWDATATANYISGSIDDLVTPNRQVASWTTVDVNLTYRFPTGQFDGSRIGLSVINLFDRDPPYAYSPSLLQPGLVFDSANASIVGRFVALTFTKRW
ncbi:TonB-dependent receptor [Asticcacaulis sp. YBE204]|uniref:TonB-dependent receptor n=1 Tax=Asticcacaulis sp. YBE204 TaxID=1282363 RepID=UPI0003C3C925|nr:TonB-dependent receptor [Asticcacaulis sp. YBE204]ESQ79305.1 hypothetical protein AEYBE204_09860 [Asticcacaulis sp. YBE204]